MKQILFEKNKDGYLLVPQPHFNLIYEAFHVLKSKEKIKELSKIYPQLNDNHCKGRVIS